MRWNDRSHPLKDLVSYGLEEDRAMKSKTNRLQIEIMTLARNELQERGL